MLLERKAVTCGGSPPLTQQALYSLASDQLSETHVLSSPPSSIFDMGLTKERSDYGPLLGK